MAKRSTPKRSSTTTGGSTKSSKMSTVSSRERNYAPPSSTTMDDTTTTTTTSSPMVIDSSSEGAVAFVSSEEQVVLPVVATSHTMMTPTPKPTTTMKTPDDTDSGQKKRKRGETTKDNDDDEDHNRPGGTSSNTESPKRNKRLVGILNTNGQYAASNINNNNNNNNVSNNNNIDMLQELTHEDTGLRECTSQKDRIHEGHIMTSGVTYRTRSVLSRRFHEQQKQSPQQTERTVHSSNDQSASTSTGHAAIAAVPSIDIHRSTTTTTNVGESDQDNLLYPTAPGSDFSSSVLYEDTSTAEVVTDNDVNVLTTLSSSSSSGVQEGGGGDTANSTTTSDEAKKLETSNNHNGDSTTTNTNDTSQPTSLSLPSRLYSFVEDRLTALASSSVTGVSIASHDLTIWTRSRVKSGFEFVNTNLSLLERSVATVVLPIETTNLSSFYRKYSKYFYFVFFILIHLLGCYDPIAIFSSRRQMSKIHISSSNSSTITETLSNNTDQINTAEVVVQTPTLRQYLNHPNGFHLAMGPAFFGFYAYFGILMTLDNEIGILTPRWNLPTEYNEPRRLLQSVSGASAGAMAAILLSSGVSPRHAADFASSLDLLSFADPPGILGLLRGWKFEHIMNTFIENYSPLSSPFTMESGVVPVAVTAFDVLTLSEQILDKGSMASAARASATFPGLFQPLIWFGLKKYYSLPSILIDGGIFDVHGLNGLEAFSPQTNARIVNVMVGTFLTKHPPGPSRMPKGIHASSVLSISILNLPECGPLSMSNGPLAVEAARRAISLALDQPLQQGEEESHFLLELHAS